MDKYKGLREDNTKKIGLRLGQSRVQQLNERNIFAKKAVGNPPISVFALEELYVPNDTAQKA